MDERFGENRRVPKVYAGREIRRKASLSNQSTLQDAMVSMSWPRAATAWLMIVVAESVDGTLRQLFIAPASGSATYDFWKMGAS